MDQKKEARGKRKDVKCTNTQKQTISNSGLTNRWSFRKDTTGRDGTRNRQTEKDRESP